MNISLPHLIFGSLISGLIGALVHLILGGKPLRLLFAILFSWIGFWAGHSIANHFQISIIAYGTINFGAGIIIALGFSLVGYWIAGENKKDEKLK